MNTVRISVNSTLYNIPMIHILTAKLAFKLLTTYQILLVRQNVKPSAYTARSAEGSFVVKQVWYHTRIVCRKEEG